MSFPRIVLLIVEEQIDDRIYRSQRALTPMHVELSRDPGKLLLWEYEIAKRQIDAEIKRVRTAGPNGKLP